MILEFRITNTGSGKMVSNLQKTSKCKFLIMRIFTYYFWHYNATHKKNFFSLLPSLLIKRGKKKEVTNWFSTRFL